MIALVVLQPLVLRGLFAYGILDLADKLVNFKSISRNIVVIVCIKVITCSMHF